VFVQWNQVGVVQASVMEFDRRNDIVRLLRLAQTQLQFMGFLLEALVEKAENVRVDRLLEPDEAVINGLKEAQL
jgi:hypothetical protein